MVLAEKTNDDVRNGRRSRAASPNNHFSEESNTDDDRITRIGDAYQASIPEFISNPPCADVPDNALLVWAPNPEIPDKKLEDYITLAKESYCYNAEQALGMLYWHKYNIEKAIADLPNFSPFPDEWSVEDKVLFEQAFQFHGKSFFRIKQMIPDKSVSSLVKYYYSWKKTRSRTSLMDRQARKLQSHKEDGSDVSEAPSENESDMDIDKEDGTNKKLCANCNSSTSRCLSTPKGLLCTTCYDYWKKTGMLRNSGGPIRKRESTSSRYNTVKNKRKPPRNMYLGYEDLVTFATGAPGQSETILRQMDTEVISFKRQVQNNKQTIGQLKHKSSIGIDHLRLQEMRPNVRWTSDELLLAVQGVRQFGKNFKAIAELIGNKNEQHVRNFFVTHRRRFNLDAVLQEHDVENGNVGEEDKEGDKAETDPVGPNSPIPATEPPMLRPTPRPPLQQVAPVRTQPPPLIRPAYNGIMPHNAQDQ